MKLSDYLKDKDPMEEISKVNNVKKLLKDKSLTFQIKGEDKYKYVGKQGLFHTFANVEDSDDTEGYGIKVLANEFGTDRIKLYRGNKPLSKENWLKEQE